MPFCFLIKHFTFIVNHENTIFYYSSNWLVVGFLNDYIKIVFEFVTLFYSPMFVFNVFFLNAELSWIFLVLEFFLDNKGNCAFRWRCKKTSKFLVTYKKVGEVDIFIIWPYIMLEPKVTFWIFKLYATNLPIFSQRHLNAQFPPCLGHLSSCRSSIEPPNRVLLKRGVSCEFKRPMKQCSHDKNFPNNCFVHYLEYWCTAEDLYVLQ